ncbi:glycoside hydrolase family 15 protein [Marinomonas ostreistagni]|uniref:glycoside hydrolase family 15 protein n=1 Tax=Marinomonas ostreistagni TaxID=359209 RepID=UPI00194E726A|nr:glycoside hydrolase family 15 protein [Marinomonas ostreistagni]MBM6549631.1 glycoside hydrolase family 15 protein [Marinomonas ostreistagni]
MSFDKATELETLYRHIDKVILSRQHPVTGLFPASTSVNNHGDYTDAWVRDNVYSIQAVWALSLAYKRASNPNKRAHELEYACIKMMRGLLFAMMRQSHKVEAFKDTLDPKDALHAKYDTKTGLEVVADDAWGHLQIDATSFYLLTLAQMTKSGSAIIYSEDELNFIQNLVYYISRTYRTPDFGIWERGNKVNNGKAEINASSVGMAKAALEALDGLNLFGENGPEWAVIHSFADAVARAGSVLESLLPKESRSKEVDGALLSIISFPAFAVNDETLKRRTRQEILDKLGGNYGCKRFLLDGHQTVIEDHSRIYYEHDELINFEHIESEWPLFFTYLYIDRLFARDWESANYYRYQLESLMVEQDGEMLLPELYYVPEENILEEKANPGSQPRKPNDNLPLVWAQSLYLVGKMLDDELITTADLDPLGLHRKQHSRKSVNISMVVLAKNKKIKQQLIDAGCLCQTIDEIDPIRVISSEQLIELYGHVGASQALGLSGRPTRALNSLAVAQPFVINEQPCLCLGWFQNEDRNYRKADPALFEQHIRNELAILSQYWYYPANAVFTVLIDEALAEMEGASELFEFIRRLQKREFNEFRVLPQSAKNAFKSGSRRLMRFDISHEHTLGAQLPVYESPWPLAKTPDATGVDYPNWETSALVAYLATQPSLMDATDILVELGKRDALEETLISPDNLTVSVRNVLDSVYTNALIHRHWLSVRQLFAILSKPTTDMATHIAEITVRQRVLVIGEPKAEQVTISTPLHHDEIYNLFQKCSGSALAQVVNHELLAITGSLLKIHPEYFAGVRTIRLHNLSLLCAYKSLECDDPEDCDPIAVLAQQSPMALYQTLRAVLIEKHKEFTHVVASVRYHKKLEGEGSRNRDIDWFEWRTGQGLITKLPEEMLQQLWNSLNQTDRIVFGDPQSNTILQSKPTLNSMTPGEDTFALLIESLTSDIAPSWYKCMIFEALYAFIQFCQQHPTGSFIEEVNLPVLVSKAALDHVKQYNSDHPEIENVDMALDEFAQLTPNKVNHYLGWAVTKLHSQQRHTMKHPNRLEK